VFEVDFSAQGDADHAGRPAATQRALLVLLRASGCWGVVAQAVGTGECLRDQETIRYHRIFWHDLDGKIIVSEVLGGGSGGATMPTAMIAIHIVPRLANQPANPATVYAAGGEDGVENRCRRCRTAPRRAAAMRSIPGMARLPHSLQRSGCGWAFTASTRQGRSAVLRQHRCRRRSARLEASSTAKQAQRPGGAPLSDPGRRRLGPIHCARTRIRCGADVIGGGVSRPAPKPIMAWCSQPRAPEITEARTKRRQGCAEPI